MNISSQEILHKDKTVSDIIFTNNARSLHFLQKVMPRKWLIMHNASVFAKLTQSCVHNFRACDKYLIEVLPTNTTRRCRFSRDAYSTYFFPDKKTGTAYDIFELRHFESVLM